MKKKLRSLTVSAALAAGAVTAAVTVTAGTASAATCASAANIFTMQADGDLWLYRHSAPTSGGFSWAGAQQVGWGWGGRTFAGPDGWLFNITTGGELRRLRYTGGGWVKFGSLDYDTIGWGWEKFVQSANRGRITVDSDGSIYTLEGDQLRWWSFDQQNRQWAPGSGRVLDRGWGRFDLIAASGQGGIKARDSSGVLHHFRYDRVTERFVVHETWNHRLTWQADTKLFSPGGDVYYTVRQSTGQLVWNDFQEYNADGWRTASGTVVGNDWGTDTDITATTNDCSVSGYWFPRNPEVKDQDAMPVAYVSPRGAAHLLRVEPGNRLTDLRDSGFGHWIFEPFGHEHTGLSNVVPGPESGTETVGTTRMPGGDVELHTLDLNGRWQSQVLKGAMRVAPSLVRRADGTLVVYAMGDKASDGGPWEGQLYYREQLPNGDFLAWKRFGDGLYDESPSVLDRGGEVTFVGRHGSLTSWFRTGAGGVPVPAERTLLPYVVGARPKLVQNAAGRILLVDVGTRAGEGAGKGAFVLREKADRSGFEDTWTFLPDVPGEEGGQVDAVVLPNGALAVSLTAGGKVYATTSKGAADGTEFHPWQQVSPEGLNADFTEHTSMRMDAGVLSVVAVSSHGSYWQFGASVPLNATVPLSFNSRQLA
ncbi:tachylectin-related carbohydrate-binding protein [Lentzea sp. NPDC058436]|uniref:tachylectin-related carbohydrate-binding protein n=1 Tax=Lentzea sp. NPDC058436 TaxID=3346499 RepID=UPI003660CCC4